MGGLRGSGSAFQLMSGSTISSKVVEQTAKMNRLGGGVSNLSRANQLTGGKFGSMVNLAPGMAYSSAGAAPELSIQTGVGGYR